MKFVNLTPHVINLVTGQDLERSGQVARVEVTYRQVEVLGGVPILAGEYGEIVGLLEPQEGVGYVVSRVVASAVKDAGLKRDDLFIPGSLIRDDAGKTIGCKGLERG